MLLRVADVFVTTTLAALDDAVRITQDLDFRFAVGHCGHLLSLVYSASRSNQTYESRLGQSQTLLIK